ncbi:cation transporter [Halieaceae bacterium IMCC14734]|uniref:Cation transporter n=1 Tax=Candidatus Litorirhabdus singularis TaxID=2518993 RepID=A0ABT3TK88_9GAMM|nr:cation diffusion facilitator family transporter [Candidatus Litorirhabdus singularis]MCX2982686.1 cation transporter [Candidatus Litorirhabdus singularis]
MNGHSHHHSNISDNSSERIGLAFFLNVAFTIIEFVGGWLTNSTAIMADAVHDLGDSLSIGSAWLLNRLGRRSADKEFTYGYRRLSLFGALLNGVVLLIGSIWVLSEAIPRLANPVMPMAEGMLALAILGVSVNGYAAYKLSHGTTLNERVLNWHLLEDVLGWVAVLIVSIVLQFKSWPILDPVLSIGFTLFILFNVFRNIVVTLKLFLQAVPDKKLLENIRQSLLADGEVDGVHHLHLWSLDGEHHVLTAHIVVSPELNSKSHKDLRARINQGLSEFGLNHTTIEIEFADEECRDA